jgi:light-harvesting complex 1 alpha chain
MHKIWMMVDPRQALLGLFTFLGVLALMIHFTLLSTERYNWMDAPKPVAAEQMSALPSSN